MFKLNRMLFGRRIDFFKRTTITVGYCCLQSNNRTVGSAQFSFLFLFFLKEKKKSANICPILRTKWSCSDLHGKCAMQIPN